MTEHARELNLTTEIIVDELFEELGIYVGPDKTGEAYIITDRNGRKIARAFSKSSAYSMALRHIASNKMEWIEG